MGGWRVDLLRARQLDADDEVRRLTRRRQGTATQARLVHRARVLLQIRDIVLGGLEVNQRHLVVQLIWVLVIDALLLTVVASTIHEQAVDQHTILRLLLHLRWLFELHDFEGEGELINGDLVLAGVGLQAASHEALREEQAADPVGVRVASRQPRLQELNSLDQVIEPGSERLERRIGNLLPVGWHDAVSQTEVHRVQGLRHDDETTDGLDEVVE
mmetsp:Transcript_6479/g.8714  ORF Transcript_6479/g.8714 Transcript_6479/m.8714 type:complete len:215 (+) Transcript_6479:342-986(+)